MGRNSGQRVGRQLSRTSIRGKRLAIREYAAACEVLLHADVLSEDERESVRQSVSNVTTKILVDKEDPPTAASTSDLDVIQAPLNLYRG